MSRFFTAGGQSIGASASASVLPMSSSLSSSHKSQGSRQRYDLLSRKYLEAGVRDRESADLLPCYLYPEEYFNKPSICVLLRCLFLLPMLKNKQKNLFHKKPRCFSKSHVPWAELWGWLVYLFISFKNCVSGTSLVAQWFTICLPMRGKWVESFLWELRVPHAMGQQSPHAATRETCAPQLLNLHATMKTQQLKKKKKDVF